MTYIFFSLLFLYQYSDICAADNTGQWKTPELFSSVERSTIIKSLRINCVLNEKCSEALSYFTDSNVIAMQAMIEEAVADRIDIVKKSNDYTNYVDYIPRLHLYKEVSILDSEKTFTKKIYLYECKRNCVQQLMINDDASNVMLMGIISRMQLYVSVYNELSKGIYGRCECGGLHYTRAFCYLPALYAELLFNILHQFIVECNEKKVHNEKKIDTTNIISFKKVLLQEIQEELCNKDNWEYKPIENRLLDNNEKGKVRSTGNKRFIFCQLDMCKVRGPFTDMYDSYNNKYLEREMTSYIRGCRIIKNDPPAIWVEPSRQIMVSKGAMRILNEAGRAINFVDNDIGYSHVLEMNHIAGTDPFSITAYDWITNKDINRCMFAYKHVHRDVITDSEYARGFTFKNRFYYGIGFADLPLWDQRIYGIEFLKAQKNMSLQSRTKKAVHQISYSKPLANDDYIMIDKEINAVAYSPYLQMTFYAEGSDLKMAYFGYKAHSKRVELLHTFKSPIKNIYVYDAWTLLIMTTDNKIYVHFGLNNKELKKVDNIIDLIKMEVGSTSNEHIIDSAFDNSTKQLAVLTSRGVYVVSLSIIKNGLESTMPVNGKDLTEEEYALSQLVSFKVGTGKEGKIPVPNHIIAWHMVCNNGRFIENELFDYAADAYNAIDFNNGQIYVMKKNDNSEGSPVLIYAPL